MRLNATERGVFWEFMFYCYKEGSLPTDEPTLAKIADVPQSVIQETWPNISKSFHLKGGRWHNRKVDEELPAIERRYEQKREAGKASAQRKLDARSTDVERMLAEADNGRPTIEQEEAQAGERSLTRTQTQTPTLGCDTMFSELFEAYPEHRRERDHLTVSAFVEIMGPLHDQDRPVLQAKILDGILRAKRSDDWKRENGQFIPSLAKFLREMRWTRQYRETKPAESQADRIARMLEERNRKAAQ